MKPIIKIRRKNYEIKGDEKGNRKDARKSFCFRCSEFRILERFFSNLKIFWNKEYDIFDDSRTDFRGDIVNLLRTTTSVVIAGFMIIVFPFQTISIVHIISLPIFLVANFLVSTLLMKKSYEKYRKYYISLLLTLFPSISLELAAAVSSDFSQFKMALIGLNVGVMYSLFLVLEFPIFHLITVSLVFCAHIILRAHLMNIESPMVSYATIFFFLAIINYIYIRHEILKYNLWKELQKKYHQQSRFQKLIKVLPNHIVLINKESWAKDQAIFCNKNGLLVDNKDLVNEIKPEKEFILHSDEFFVEEDIQGSICKAQQESIPLEGQSLKSLIEFMLREEKHNGEFFTFIVSLKNSNYIEQIRLNTKHFKFELKIGWINWGEDDVLLLLFNDISNIDEIRHLKSLHKNKDKLLGSISHELRTPLNGIIGMIDISEQELGDMNSKVKYYLNIARASSKTLTYLINNILDMAQIQRGTLEIRNELTNLKNLMDPIVSLIAVDIKNKGLTFTYENSINDEMNVYVDPNRFQQILINLLKNAIKFTQKGSVKLSLKLKRNEEIGPMNLDEIDTKNYFQSYEDNTNSDFGSNISYSRILEENREIHPFARAIISVEDTGEGIPPENLGKIFSLINEKDRENNPFQTGVGLGLTVSQSLAKLMLGGRIHVQSTFKEGSLFWFSLFVFKSQFKASSDLEISEEPKYNRILDIENFLKRKAFFDKKNLWLSGNSGANTAGDYHILVVDDDPINHLVVEKYLEAFGSHICIGKAYNGHEALLILNNKASEKIFYDLILMDHDMPLMNGLEACKKIKEMVKINILQEVGIVVFTANVSVTDRKAYQDYGIIDIWTKPIPRVDFIEKIKERMKFKYKMI